jgi:aminoglycoside 3-N-acetyltransferase
VHALGGQVRLLGLGHSENTTLHVAETIAEVPYSVSHPCVVEIEGVVRTVMIAETDDCDSGRPPAERQATTRLASRT